MADSDESVELLFFDTFSHDINEVNYSKMIVYCVQYCIQLKNYWVQLNFGVNF